MSIPTTLAIDFGTKRIGLAISVATLADPLTIIPNDENSVAKIKEICAQENVKQLLVGVSEQVMAEKTKVFAQQLKEKIDLPLFFVDETLSSKETHQKLSSSQMKLSKRQGPIDHYAASLFLQEWLDYLWELPSSSF